MRIVKNSTSVNGIDQRIVTMLTLVGDLGTGLDQHSNLPLITGAKRTG